MLDEPVRELADILERLPVAREIVLQLGRGLLLLAQVRGSALACG